MRLPLNKTVFVSLIFAASILLLSKCDRRETPDFSLAHNILGSAEKCFDCHQGMRGFSPSHQPELIGCTPCHLGDPLAQDKKEAHKDMVLIPGNFNDMHRTCGTTNCHHDIIPRIENSLMSTMSGVVSVNRCVFGESDTLDHQWHVKDLTKETAADMHLRQLCASCHLGNEKKNLGPITEKSRGGGCNACHLQYDRAMLEAHELYSANKDSFLLDLHPALTVEVNNDKCFGCHSRSGRISTSYEGWHETKLSSDEMRGPDQHRLLQDGRVFEMIVPDVHHLAGLECIDCHPSSEVMGDGNSYLHQEQAVKIKCSDCHQDGKNKRVLFADLDAESKKLIAIRKWALGDEEFVFNEESKLPLYNVLSTNDSVVVIGKNSGERYHAKPPADPCTRGNAHQAMSCQTCHSGWSPQCIGCHNTFEPETFAMDLLDHKKVKGKWIEHIGLFFSDRPTLGVVEELENDIDIRQIKTFVSGMILSIDKSGVGGHEDDPEIFHRLYAPLDAHTTTVEARDCKSCHLSPLAIGYGRGQLELVERGGQHEWRFLPEYADSKYDGLPQDAWIDFLEDPNGMKSTRHNARPFDLEEQYSILRVGACLTCHDGQSKVMQNSLEDFDAVIDGMIEGCVDPIKRMTQ